MSATPTRKRQFVQFSLRGLLAVIAALAVWLGFAFHRAREQAAAVAAIRAMGGDVYYDYQIVGDFDYHDLTATSKVPSWLLDNVGVDFFHDVTEVNFFRCAITDDDLSILKALPETGFLWIDGANITNEGLARLKSLGKLETLFLDSPCADQADIDDLGVAHVAELAELRHLSIGRANVTDRSLEELKRLNQLTMLALHYSRVTPAGAEAFQRSMPHCNVMVIGDYGVFFDGPDEMVAAWGKWFREQNKSR